MKGRIENYKAVKAHSQLLRIHGSVPDTCGNCAFFRTREFSKTYFKCLKINNTSSASTDWRKRWLACGLFQSTAVPPVIYSVEPYTPPVPDTTPGTLF